MSDTANLTVDSSFEQLLRRIVREETQDIRDEVQIVKNDLQTVKSDVRTVKDEVQTVKTIVGGHGLQLQALQSDMRITKATTRQNIQETYRLGVLLDDFNDRWAAGQELHSA